MRRLTSSLDSRLLPLLCAALLLSACGDDKTSAEEGSETTAMSSTAGTSTEESTTDDGTDPDTSTTNDTASFVAEEGPGTTESAPGNLGDMCQSDSECAEDLFCNGIAGFGGICSECGGDADCPENSNCTLSSDGWFACGDGGIGQLCELDTSCAEGLYCAELINLGGLFMANFCSECSEDMHCENGQLCVPQLEFADIMDFSGQRACVDPGTHPNGSLCDFETNGAEQCEGFCTVASLMGFVDVGLCGECESDADCIDEMTCAPAQVGLEGFSGSFCM